MAVITEIDALKTVDETLSAIDKEARVRVLDWANSKYSDSVVSAVKDVDASVPKDQAQPFSVTSITKKAASKAKSKTKSTKKSKPTFQPIKDLDLYPSGKISAKDFVTEKKPTNHKQKCVVALYYLLNFLNLETVSIDHIYTFFKSCNWKLPTDLPNMMSQAGSAGWLDTSNLKDIRLTPMGENLITHDLPKKQKQGE